MSAPRSVPAYHVADGRCRHCGRSKPTWTPAAILSAMRDFNAKHGRAPYKRDWKRARVISPAASTVEEVFGTWSEALREAGLHAPLRSNTLHVWTRDEVIAAIFEWRYARGRLPRANEWSVQKTWRPSEKQVRMLFGSWNAALEAAGYEPTLRKRAA